MSSSKSVSNVRDIRLADALGRLLDLACGLFEVPVAFIWVPGSEATEPLRVVRGLSPSAPSTAGLRAAVEAAAGVLVVSGDHALLDDPLLQAAGARFAAGVALERPEAAPGVLAILDETPRTFTASQQERLRHIAGVASDALVLGGQAETLREDRPLLESISHQLADGVYRSTLAGQIVYANEAMARIFGYDGPEDLLGRHMAVLYKNVERRAELIRRTARRHGFKNEEVEFVRKDGTAFWGLLSCNAVFDREGHMIAYDGVVGDVITRHEYVQDLIAGREQAVEVARQQTRLLADLSHEIRTPLTAIIGFAEVLVEQAVEQNREYARLIRQSGKRLVRTLNSILDLARLEDGTLSLSMERLDAVKRARQVVDLFGVQAQQRNLDLQLIAPEAPVIVWLDGGAFDRVLTNLVSNAIKYTPEGYVHVVLEAEAAELEVRVEDSGVGISEAFLPLLFGEFSREAKGLANESEGSGLGLAITHHLVSLMGGTIYVESKKGRGSIFTVHLPREGRFASNPPHGQE